jgi:hypothetical protein
MPPPPPPPSSRQRAHLELERLHRVKQSAPPPTPKLGPELISFFKHSVERRQTKLAKIAECWARLIPSTLLERCALESFHAGTLKVVVDSSAHLYEMKQLLLSGLQDQILLACKSTGLRRVTLKLGRWYVGDDARDRKVRF